MKKRRRVGIFSLVVEIFRDVVVAGGGVRMLFAQDLPADVQSFPASLSKTKMKPKMERKAMKTERR